MAKLTKRFVDSVNPDAKRELFFWDDELPGFGLRVFPTGRRSYIVQYRRNQRASRRMTIGHHGLVTPSEARKRAHRILAAAHIGEDPAGQVRKASEAPTIEALARRYLEEYAEVRKKPSSVNFDRQMIERFLVPALGKLSIGELTREDVRRLHDGMRRTPYQANRAINLLSKMLNLAEAWGLRPDGTNPTRHIERFKEHSRERFLSERELLRLGDVLVAEEIEARSLTDSMRRVRLAEIGAVRLLIFTGCRVGEVLGCRWEEVDLQVGCLRLRDSKTGPRVVFLNLQAIELLREVAKSLGDSEWVFPGRNVGRPLVNLSKFWRRVRVRAALEDVRLHDLRHSFASVAVSSGLPLPIIGKLLGHNRLATTEKYAHLSEDPVRRGSQLVGDRLAEAMSGGRAAELQRRQATQ